MCAYDVGVAFTTLACASYLAKHHGRSTYSGEDAHTASSMLGSVDQYKLQYQWAHIVDHKSDLQCRRFAGNKPTVSYTDDETPVGSTDSRNPENDPDIPLHNQETTLNQTLRKNMYVCP